MFRNRMFNISLIVALVIVTARTIQQALETTRVVSAAGTFANRSPCHAAVMDRSSIRSVYEEEIGMWVSRSDSGPTDVDGGLLHLLSDYRICSQ